MISPTDFTIVEKFKFHFDKKQILYHDHSNVYPLLKSHHKINIKAIFSSEYPF